MIGWQVKAIGAALILAALGGLLWHDHHQTHRANVLAQEKAQLETTLATERANRQIEQDDRRKADASAKNLMAELDRIRNAPKPVSVFCRARVPGSTGQGGASPSADGSTVNSGTGEANVDVGNQLRAVWIEAKSNAATLTALQQWEETRTH